MKRFAKNMTIISLLIAYILIYVFYVLVHVLKYSESITAASLIAIAYISYVFYGFIKDKRTYTKKSIIQIILTQIFLYFVVIYGVGFIVGFLKNSYSLALHSIIDNIFAPICIIVSLETIRYIFVNANKDKKLYIVLLTIVLIGLDFAMNVKAYNLSTVSDVFRLVTIVVIPSIIKHSLLSYLSYHVGLKPCLIYRIIIDGYIYLVPVSPDLGDYLSSMFGIALPFLIYLYSSRFINEYNKGVEHEFAVKTTFRVGDLLFIVVFAMLAALISGYFPIFMLGVGSASMEPTIMVGDAVVAKTVKSEKELKKDDILVYNGSDKTIVHRLVSIEEKDGKTIFHTKGDNNNGVDVVDLELKDIKGKVLFKIPYIAYPSVYISNYFSKEAKS